MAVSLEEVAHSVRTGKTEVTLREADRESRMDAGRARDLD
jgi:hypothetical protein